jgi:hypothetical protein
MAPAFQPATSNPEETPELPAPVKPEGMITSHSQAKPAGKTIKLFGKWPVPRRRFITLLTILGVLIVACGGAAYYQFVLNKEQPVPTAKVVAEKPKPKPAPIVSPLTGNVVDSKDKTTWPVIGVMIENSPDARPQSGLKDAGVVYEAIAEGGITRFLALYQEDRPGNIGPIRSSRPYYLDWAMAFDASYAHVGGSPDALARIKSIGVHDMDQFYNAGSYHRVTSRYAPHNVYTSVQALADLSARKGWATSSFTPFTRKADKPYKAPATDATGSTGTQPKVTAKTAAAVAHAGHDAAEHDTRTPANGIGFAISGSYYNVHYDYDPATNLYRRSEGGAPHLDAETKTQLSPKVVIALVMPYSLMSDGYHSQYNTQGTGKMFVFQDGTVTTGTWSKGDPKSQFEFKDDSGKTLALDAGQTWISIVGDAGKVSYK